MTLKVELKPSERIVVGRSVITNGATRTSLLIDGKEPVLRERDILRENDADTPAKRICYSVQMMYLGGATDTLLPIYTQLTRDALKAAPSMIQIVERMNNCVLTGQLYKAFREARNLVAYEKSIFEHAERSAGLRKDGANDGDPRERDAQLLLRAAARFAAAQTAQPFDQTGAREAATFNRKLWTVFLSSVSRPENPLDQATKTNLKKIAMFVLRRCSMVEVNPQADQLTALININRNLAEGLRH